MNKSRFRDTDKALAAQQQAKRFKLRSKEDTENQGDNEITMQGSFITSTSHEIPFKLGKNHSVAQEFKLQNHDDRPALQAIELS